MLETDLGSRIHPNEGDLPGRIWGSHQFGLVAICGIEAGAVASIVVEMAIHNTGVLWLVASNVTVLAAVIVAFALLRLIDACALNQQVLSASKARTETDGRSASTAGSTSSRRRSAGRRYRRRQPS